MASQAYFKVIIYQPKYRLDNVQYQSSHDLKVPQPLQRGLYDEKYQVFEEHIGYYVVFMGKLAILKVYMGTLEILPK